MEDPVSEDFVQDEIQDQEPAKKYKKYDLTLLNLAVEDKKKNNLSFAILSKKYGIPPSTIHDHFKGNLKLENGAKRGRKTVLNEEEESKISEWVKKCSQMGDPRTCEDLRIAAAEVRQSRQDDSTPCFKNTTPSPFWVKSYMKRNADISIRTPETITRAAANVTEGRIRNFFEKVYSYFEENNILDVLDRPEAIVNLDETAFALNPSLKRVLAQRGTKNVYSVDSGKGKESITVNFAFSADGKVLPPQIIFKESFSRMGDAAYVSGKVGQRFIMCRTANGWQTKGSFDKYLRLLIEEMEDVPKPIVFFFDNHSSHINMELFKYCHENNIHLITFPPNCTHILQMADVSMFGPAKTAWRKEMHDWKVRNHDEEMDAVKFIPVLKKVIDSSLTKENIAAGFRATGIYPFDVNQVDYKKCLGADNFYENPGIGINQNMQEEYDFNQQNFDHQNVEHEATNNENQENEILDTIEGNEAISSGHFRRYEFNETECEHDSESYPDYLMADTSQSLITPPEDLVIEKLAFRDGNENYIETVELDTEITNVQESMDELNFYLSKAREYSQKAHDLLKGKYGNKYDLNISVIHQQCDFIEAGVKSDISEQNNPKTIDDILIVPEKYSRKTNKIFKQKGYGPMTDENLLANYDAIQSEIDRKEEEKEKRKVEREEKKAIKLNKMKIKKEKVEAALKANEKRGRGRPKKTK